MYIIVIGVVVAALTTWASGDLNNTGNFTSARNLDYSLSSAMEIGINNIRYTPVDGSINASPPVACWGSGTYATTSTPTYTTYSTYQLPTSTSATYQNIALWCSTKSIPKSAVTRTVTVSACPAPSASTIATAWATSSEIESAATACAAAPDLQALVSFGDYEGSKSVPGYGASLQDWDWSSSVQSTILPNSIDIESSIPEFPVANSSYLAQAAASSGDAVVVTASPASSCTVSGDTVTFVANNTTCDVLLQRSRRRQLRRRRSAGADNRGGPSRQLGDRDEHGYHSDRRGAVHPHGEPRPPVTPSSLSVDSTTSPANACSVSSGTVTFYAAGSCVLDFNDPGNTDYVAAEGTQSISVGAGPPSGLSILGNPSTPASGAPSNGDSLTYQYSQIMSQSSMYSGFTGSANICVDLTTSGTHSSYQTVWNVVTYSGGACKSTVVNLGSVNLGDGANGNYITYNSTAVFLRHDDHVDGQWGLPGGSDSG